MHEAWYDGIMRLLLGLLSNRASGSCIGGSGHGVAMAAVWRVTRWVNRVLLLSNTRMVDSPFMALSS